MKAFTLLFTLLILASSHASELFVAIGYGGRRMTSTDGQTWENVQQWVDKNADDSNNLISMVFGKGKFICVGGGGWTRETQAGHILASEDGKAWREVAKYPFRVSPILFNGDRFVAGGPSKQLLYSIDGEKWSEGEAPKLPADIPGWAFWYRHGAAGNGIFAFMGNAGGKEHQIWWCITTKDGEKIDSFSTNAPGDRGIAFGAGKFVALKQDAIFTSTNATEWTPVSDAPKDDLRGVIWSGKSFILTAKSGTYLSPDGVTWKPFGKSPPGNIVWAGERGLISTSWPGRMYFSTDGQTWKSTGQPTPGLGVNVVVSNDGK